MSSTIVADRLTRLATVLAAAAAAIGLLIPVYRDIPAMVDQAQGTDLATLFGAVPLLVVGSVLIARGVARGAALGRVITVAALGYLVYTYAIYAFQVVVNPMTPVHIAILGLAAWSIALTVPTLGPVVGDVGDALPRRTTAVFLAVVVVLFGALWLSQIASAISSGVLPAAVSDLGLPTSAVYALDLAFALPALALGAALLARRSPFGGALALGGLVFALLMTLSILGLFGVQAFHGAATDGAMIVAFGVVGLVAAVLAVRGVGASWLPVGTRLATAGGRH